MKTEAKRERERRVAIRLAVDALVEGKPEWTERAAKMLAQAMKAPADLDRIRERLADPVTVAQLALTVGGADTGPV